jgi:hypothetical protein
MNPFFSLVDWLGVKATLLLYKATGTPQSTLDAFEADATTYADQTGELTPPQVSDVVTADVAKVKSALGYVKIAVVIAIVLAVIWVFKKFKSNYRSFFS